MRRRIGLASVALLGSPRSLRQQVHAEPDRHPDDGLGGHRRDRVGARVVARRLVLDHDHVHLLKREQERQTDDGDPGAGQQVAQALAVVGERPRQTAMKRDEQGEADRDDGERARDERPGHVQPDAHQQEGEEEATGGLGHEAPAEQLVALQSLQGAALDRDDHPEHARDRHGGGGPELIDVDYRSEQRAQGDRHQRDDDRAQHQPQQPTPHPAAGHRVVRRHGVADLPSRGDLERGPGDHQDDERRDEDRQRPVAGRTQHTGEHDREHERDPVGGEHRNGQPGGAPGVRRRQRAERW